MPSRPLLDETAALGAARLVVPSRHANPTAVARLRAEVVSDLPRIDAAARAWSQLGADLPPTRMRVVGRFGWVRANLAALRGAFDPLADKLRIPSSSAGPRRLARRALGVQVGALLGLLSTKVLGQYILPLGAPGTGQLVVLGPNLLDLEEQHGPLAVDIRRSVLLHEVTHRLQFDGVPWLGDHLRDLLSRYLSSARIDGTALVEAAGRLPEAVGRARDEGSVQPLVEAVLTPEQAEVVREAQGMMTLLEGHGNAAMFLGADGVVADRDQVRDALRQRRDDVTSKVLTAVAGLDMKRRQYREGEAFVRGVVDRAGVAGLNRAFASPENLPRPDEVADPDAWLARVGDGGRGEP